MIYNANNISFELPEFLKDKSVFMFSIVDDGPSDFNLVITRAPLNGNDDLNTYTARQVVELSSKLTSFKVLRQQDILVKETPAMFLDYTWASNIGPVQQYQVSFAATNPLGKVREVVMFTATCKGQFTPQWNETFRNVISSLKIQAV
jgi:hypothetical protein